MTVDTLTELDFGEYINHSPHGDVNPKWEHLEYDNTHCMRGHRCPTYNREHGTTMAIGGYIGSDSEGIYPKHEWESVWYYPSAPTLVMCENCADLIEATLTEPTLLEPVDTVFSGTIADADWFIDLDFDGDGFYAWIGYFSPDHGLDHEIELGFHETVGDAHAAIAAWGAARDAELDKGK